MVSSSKGVKVMVCGLDHPGSQPFNYTSCLWHSVLSCCSGDYLLERAEDFLVADDPALFSDEFSEPEEWGFG